MQLHVESSPLTGSSIVAALEEELGRPVRVADDAQALSVSVNGKQLLVTVRRGAATPVERRIQLPDEPARQLDTIALLVGNMARDEAGRLLAGLAQPQAASETVPVPSEMPDASGQPAEPLPMEPAPQATASAGSAEQAEVDEPREEPSEQPSGEPVQPLGRAPFNLTFVSPLSLHPDLWRRETSMMLGALYADFGALRGVALGGLGLRNRGGGRGVQIAGLWSTTAGPFQGVNLAGLASFASGGQKGPQIAGIVAHQSGDLSGPQVSLVNVVGGKFMGVQAGLTNVAGDVRGVQVGLVNFSSGTVRGTQVGLVNIGKGLEGTSVGLVSINPDVRIQAVGWASLHFEQGGGGAFSAPWMGHVGVKYLAGRFYSLLGLGLSERGGCVASTGGCANNQLVLAPGFGVGARFDVVENLFVETDGYVQWELSTPHGQYGTQAVLARAALGYQVLPALAVVLGAGPRMDVAAESAPSDVTFSPHFFGGIQLF